MAWNPEQRRKDLAMIFMREGVQHLGAFGACGVCVRGARTSRKTPPPMVRLDDVSRITKRSCTDAGDRTFQHQLDEGFFATAKILVAQYHDAAGHFSRRMMQLHGKPLPQSA